jgi:hypothetical protein
MRLSDERQRAPKSQTKRGEAASACAAHLRDLRKIHSHAPPDVILSQQSVPTRLWGEPTSSYCTSPAALCAELAE